MLQPWVKAFLSLLVALALASGLTACGDEPWTVRDVQRYFKEKTGEALGTVSDPYGDAGLEPIDWEGAYGQFEIDIYFDADNPKLKPQGRSIGNGFYSTKSSVEKRYRNLKVTFYDNADARRRLDAALRGLE